MNGRHPERAARRQALQTLCAQQRARLAVRLTEVQQHLQPIDVALGALQSLRRAPVLLGAAAALAGLVARFLTGRRRTRGVGTWTEWLALAGPVLQPVLGMLERWWQARRSADTDADPAADASGESAHPGHR
jgi:hypothetical protein